MVAKELPLRLPATIWFGQPPQTTHTKIKILPNDFLEETSIDADSRGWKHDRWCFPTHRAVCLCG